MDTTPSPQRVRAPADIRHTDPEDALRALSLHDQAPRGGSGNDSDYDHVSEDGDNYEYTDTVENNPEEKYPQPTPSSVFSRTSSMDTPHRRPTPSSSARAGRPKPYDRTPASAAGRGRKPPSPHDRDGLGQFARILLAARKADGQPTAGAGDVQGVQIPLYRPVVNKELDWKAQDAHERAMEMQWCELHNSQEDSCVQLDPTVWDKQDPDYCPACRTTQTPEQQKEDPSWSKLMSFMQTNFASMSARAFTEEAQLLYNQDCRDKASGLPWRRRVIYEHVTSHAPSMMILHECMLRELNQQMQHLSRNEMYREVVNAVVPKHELIPDKARLYMHLVDKARPLFAAVAAMRQRQNKT